MSLTYDGSSAKLEGVLERHRAGEPLHCATCGAELLVALTHADAERLNISPGVFCPASIKHVAVFCVLRAPTTDAQGPPPAHTPPNPDEKWFQHYRRLKGWDK